MESVVNLSGIFDHDQDSKKSQQLSISYPSVPLCLCAFLSCFVDNRIGQLTDPFDLDGYGVPRL